MIDAETQTACANLNETVVISKKEYVKMGTAAQIHNIGEKCLGLRLPPQSRKFKRVARLGTMNEQEQHLQTHCCP